MAYSVAGLNTELLHDNANYEAHKLGPRSALHTLVNILRGPRTWTAASIAAEMKKIAKADWNRYPLTRQYLEREIAGLTVLLRAIPTGFATVRMTGNPENTNLRHEFKWVSDTGDLADLATVKIREHVTWGQWPPELTACIDEERYTHPDVSYGLKANTADPGSGVDSHALQGPFGPRVFNFNHAPARAPMSQVYEYSYDQATWFAIPNSSFTIVREVSNVRCNLGGNHVQIKLTKTNTTRPNDTFSIAKVL